MYKDLSNYRKSYEKKELLEKDCPESPMDFFHTWFTNADLSDMVDESNAMTLSSIGLDGYPKNRIVLLKHYSAKGFVFYTSYRSEKGNAITNNNLVCLSFFWAGLEQQIIVKGTAEKLEEKLSDAYFQSRPEGSKLGALASKQSEVIPSRELLDNQLALLKEKYHKKEIPRPSDWGGYLVQPISIEFWQGRPNRMHDRIRYTLEKNNWKLERLSP